MFSRWQFLFSPFHPLVLKEEANVHPQLGNLVSVHSFQRQKMISNKNRTHVHHFNALFIVHAL